MSQLKQHLQFSRQEQTAIVVLLVILVLLIAVNVMPWPLTTERKVEIHNLDSIFQLHQMAQMEQERLREQNFDVTNPDAAVLADKLKPFSFNPNKLPEADWKKMGLSDRQIRNIKNYEKSGGKFFRKEDLKKIYTISEAEYQILEPFIEIPEPKRARLARASELKTGQKEQIEQIEQENVVTLEAKTPNVLVEINTADSVELLSLPGIGPWFAHRIIQFRDLLGGYLQKEQLLEVYGMDTARAESVYDLIRIDTAKIRKIRLNYDDFRTLVRQPYMSYELTKAVVNYRNRKGQIKSFEQLRQLNTNPEELTEKLKYYIDYE